MDGMGAENKTTEVYRSPNGRNLKYVAHLTRRSPLTVLGLLILFITVLLAVISPYVAPYPEDITYASHLEVRLKPPSLVHLFGTDDLGRDIFSRVIYGTRISLIIGLIVISIALTIGSILGAIAGYVGGIVDEILMRITDIFLSVPSLVLALSIAASLGPSLVNAMIAISLVWWPWYARLVRGQTLTLKELDFVEAARSLGVSTHMILLRHILPNCLAPIVVQGSLDVGYAILTAASLGFLGVGAQPPTAEWGLMIGYGRQFFPTWWWVAVFPGIAIFFVVLGFNLLGDGLRDILDPRLRRE